MVAVVIGLVTMFLLYQALIVSEKAKHHTSGIGDAQQNGLFSLFALALDIGNGGNGIALAAPELATCVDTGNIATTLRPIAVLLNDSGSNDAPDQIVVNYSVANILIATAEFVASAPAGSSYQVRSASGFSKGDLIVAISMAGACERARPGWRRGHSTQRSQRRFSEFVAITQLGSCESNAAHSL